MAQRRVYLDTNVFKFSATRLRRLRPKQQRLSWGGVEHHLTVNEVFEHNPNAEIETPKLKSEAELLPRLAEFGKHGRVEYCIQMETQLESWGLPNMDSLSRIFYGAPYTMVEAPIEYSRVVRGGRVDAKQLQFKFLASLDDSRFVEIQKIVGARQGEGRIVENQLLDAFFLWCAEYNRCEFFLTLDFKLGRMIANQRKEKVSVKVVKPSELLLELGETPN